MLVNMNTQNLEINAMHGSTSSVLDVLLRFDVRNILFTVIKYWFTVPDSECLCDENSSIAFRFKTRKKNVEANMVFAFWF